MSPIPPTPCNVFDIHSIKTIGESAWLMNVHVCDFEKGSSPFISNRAHCERTYSIFERNTFANQISLFIQSPFSLSFWAPVTSVRSMVTRIKRARYPIFPSPRWDNHSSCKLRGGGERYTPSPLPSLPLLFLCPIQQDSSFFSLFLPRRAQKKGERE